MSIPFSMIVVATRMSSFAFDEALHDRFDSDSLIWPCPTSMRAFGTSLLERVANGEDRFDPVVEVVDLAAAVEFGGDRVLHDRVAHRNDDAS